MKSFALLFAVFIPLLHSFSQENNEQEVHQIAERQFSVYLAHDFFLMRSLNIEKTFLLGERTALGGRIGLGNDYGNRNLSGIAEIIFLFGKKRHYLETGIGYQQPFYYFESGPDPPALALMVGYRFMGRNGLLFKIYPEFIPAIFPDPESYGSLPFLGIALGYSL